ncbi:hypothetical protein SORBI_3009G199401 [Sorghum bicolor]|uniref:Uncharacterized protein n=1 Tax=Sorghum bicolor TaxID=4558 RepID=A0A1Z5R450_SORBI|nr:hypothetical protein SORBI_3009G199401 [Sorghum bicolor]
MRLDAALKPLRSQQEDLGCCLTTGSNPSPNLLFFLLIRRYQHLALAVTADRRLGLGLAHVGGRLHIGVLLRRPLLQLQRRAGRQRRALVAAGLGLGLEGLDLALRGGVRRRARALEPLAAAARDAEEVSGGGSVGILDDVADVVGSGRRGGRPGAGAAAAEQRRGGGGGGPGVDLHDGVSPEHGVDGVDALVPLGAEDGGAGGVVGRGGEQVEQPRAAVELGEEDGGVGLRVGHGRIVHASLQPLRSTRQPLQLIRIFASSDGGGGQVVVVGAQIASRELAETGQSSGLGGCSGLGGAPVVLERWGEGGFGAAGPAGLGWSATARLAVCLPVAPAGPALQEAASEERIRGAKKLEAAEGSKSGGRRRAPAGPWRGAARRAATTFRPVGRQAGSERREQSPDTGDVEKGWKKRGGARGEEAERQKGNQAGVEGGAPGFVEIVQRRPLFPLLLWAGANTGGGFWIWSRSHRLSPPPTLTLTLSNSSRREESRTLNGPLLIFCYDYE